MKRIVRESKFRNILPQNFKKEQTYDGIIAGDTRLDGNICAFNRKFIACVLNVAKGLVFTVLKVNRNPGRIDSPPRVVGHTTPIIDLSWDRFYANRIATCSEDGNFMVWVLPEEGLKPDEEFKTFSCQVSVSNRRAIQCEWHTSASDILFGVTLDSIGIINVSNNTILRRIDSSKFPDQIFHFALNYNSSKYAVSSKDKKVRVFDMNTNDMLSEFATHEGTKTIRVAWYGRPNVDELILTTGTKTNSEKEIYVWDITSSPTKLCSMDFETSATSFNMLYDHDTKLIMCYARGESRIYYLEYESNPPQLIHNAPLSTGGSQKACVFGNKLCVDFSSNEIFRVLRVCNKSIEPMSITVPRVVSGFQDDIFPDTFSEDPAMTAEEFSQGKICDPILKSLNGMVFSDGTVPMSISGENTASLTGINSPSVGGSSSGRSVMNIFELNNEVAELKSQLHELKEKFEHFSKNH